VTGRANRFARIEVSTAVGPGGERLRITRNLDTSEESIVQAATGQPWVRPVVDDGATGQCLRRPAGSGGAWWTHGAVDASQL
jgi:hypothetical protein